MYSKIIIRAVITEEDGSNHIHLYNNDVMTEKEKQIQLIITTKNVDDKESDNCHVVHGIDELDKVIKLLHFNGTETIFVHLYGSIEKEAADITLIKWCKKLVDNKLVNYARHEIMGVPEYGSTYSTILDAENKLTENRYMVTYNKD